MIALDDNGHVILTDEIPDIRQFIVREITEVHEFEELFHLRYRVYRNSRLASFCSPCEAEVDINRYDLTSRHLGLFLQEREGERLVGCCRGVTGEESPWLRKLSEAARRVGVNLDARPESESPFPCIDHLPDGQRILGHYRDLARSGRRVLEASRLCVEDIARSPHAARFFLEAVFSFFVLHLGYDAGMCYVARSQRRFYESYGFTRIPGVDDQLVAHAGVKFTPLCILAECFHPSKAIRLYDHRVYFDATAKVAFTDYESHSTTHAPVAVAA